MEKDKFGIKKCYNNNIGFNSNNCIYVYKTHNDSMIIFRDINYNSFGIRLKKKIYV